MRISNIFTIPPNQAFLSRTNRDNVSAVSFGALPKSPITEKIFAPKISFESISKMERLEANLRILKELFSKLKELCNYRNKYAKFRSEYAKYVSVGGRGWGLQVQDWIISVAKPETYSNLTKIYARKEQEAEPHLFLIEDNRYVLANSNNNQPRKVPRVNNYMSQAQIKESRVEDLISVADKELCEYLDYLKSTIENLQNATSGKKVDSDKSITEEVSITRETKPVAERVVKPLGKTGVATNILAKPQKAFPDVIKLSEIDDIFKELTGKTIAQAADPRGSVSDPRKARLRGEEPIAEVKKTRKPRAKSVASRKDVKPNSEPKEVVKTALPTKEFERTVWGLTNYVEANDNFRLEAYNGTEFFISRVEVDGLEYLSIIKKTPDGRKTYFNIDCDNEKLLKTDLTRKPMIKDGEFVPYSEDELKILNLQETFDSALDDIFNTLENDGVKTKPLVPRIQMLQSEEVELNQDSELTKAKSLVAEAVNIESEKKSLEMVNLTENIEEIKTNARSKAKVDAKEIANEYFKTFVEEFKSEMTKKMEEIEQIKKEIFEKKI